MGFANVLQDKSPAPVVQADAILWGVHRKFGYSEIDDPSVHRGLIQHAFLVGDYDSALCGYQPYGRKRPGHIRLAVPTTENPTCRKCSAAIAFETTESSPLEMIQALAEPVRRAEAITVDKHLLPERAGMSAPRPASIKARGRFRSRAKARAQDYARAA